MAPRSHLSECSSTNGFSKSTHLPWGVETTLSLVPASSSLLPFSVQLSDTQVYEPDIRALLKTSAHFCEVVPASPHNPFRNSGEVDRRVFHLDRVPLEASQGESHHSTLHPRPQTPDPRPQTSDPRPQTPDTRHQTPDTRHQTPDTRHQTPDPRPQTPDPKPQTQNPRPKTPDPRPHAPRLTPQNPDPRPQTPDPKPPTPSS